MPSIEQQRCKVSDLGLVFLWTSDKMQGKEFEIEEDFFQVTDQQRLKLHDMPAAFVEDMHDELARCSEKIEYFRNHYMMLRGKDAAPATLSSVRYLIELEQMKKKMIENFFLFSRRERERCD